MKKASVLILSLIILSLLISCKSKKDSLLKTRGYPEYAYVNKNGVNVRTAPAQTDEFGRIISTTSDKNKMSRVVSALSAGKKVKLLSRSEKQYKLGNKSDFWYKISIDSINGYVFGKNISFRGVSNAR
jgi:hypothetical protein